MPVSSKRRPLLVVSMFVLALTAAVPSHAAGLGGIDAFWSWFLGWVPVTGQSDIGPIIDPNGRKGKSSVTDRLDSGPIIDPWGRNGAPPATGQSDSGPMIDPDGR